MCKVKCYLFACKHWQTLLESRCRGTKVKNTRSNGRRAACSSRVYLTVNKFTECNKCWAKTWDRRQNDRIARAKSFLETLKSEGSPAVEEVDALFEQLTGNCFAQSWDLHKELQFTLKTSVERVKPATPSQIQRVNSLLRRRVEPHQVYIHQRMATTVPTYDDDGEDFVVRSTDPLHSVCTNYEIPPVGVDDSVLAEFIQEPEVISETQDEGFDPSIIDSWGDGMDAEEQTFDDLADAPNSSRNTQADWNQEGDWSCHDYPPTPPRSPKDLQKQIWEGCSRDQQIARDIERFWETVNLDNQQAQNSAPSDDHQDEAKDSTTIAPEADLLLEGLDESLSTDTSSENQQLNVISPTQQRRDNSQDVEYGRIHDRLEDVKKDTREYARLFLVEARIMIKKIVGPEGEIIKDPEKPKKRDPDDGNN